MSPTHVILCVTAVLAASQAMSLMEDLADANCTALVDLLKSTGLDKEVESGYLTLFAPTNDAFKMLPDDLTKTVTGNATILAAVLSFHATSSIFRAQDAVPNMLIDTVLKGSKIRVNIYDDKAGGSIVAVNGAKVIKADIPASNGIVHIIDRVMFPPAGTFYELVSMSEAHTELKKVIDSVSYKNVLDSHTGTFFAPTDDAFKALEAQLKARGVNLDGNSVAVKEFIDYHVLDTVVYSVGAKTGMYDTWNHGERLGVTMMANGTAKINQATVILGDIPATNGVMHVIDSVLIPEPYATNIVIG
ncbi:transforming growth factor-beta-induced protein ig-h3 [Plakobranchus ocellatus]|uniref:Transforming growth factor-beta-induced protein ig-h3 n=1 Tax=Plakobranchus ocellatus TaxID=259542 RepID=A0AAV4ADS3_9GAST|nr:transforming growth factor-beta-induced protein ig-h3 [Plakobranchus ocellatus]